MTYSCPPCLTRTARMSLRPEAHAMNDNRPKRTSERIYPRVAPTLAQRLAKHAAASGISERRSSRPPSSSTSTACPPTPRSSWLARPIGARTGAQSARPDAHAEAFIAYVNMWYANTPTLPEGAARDKAVASADERLKRFLAYVAQQVSRVVPRTDAPGTNRRRQRALRHQGGAASNQTPPRARPDRRHVRLPKFGPPRLPRPHLVGHTIRQRGCGRVGGFCV